LTNILIHLDHLAREAGLNKVPLESLENCLVLLGVKAVLGLVGDAGIVELLEGGKGQW
jgi:hypothetical protein